MTVNFSVLCLTYFGLTSMVFLVGCFLTITAICIFFKKIKGTVMQIEKAMINDRLRFSKVS